MPKFRTAPDPGLLIAQGVAQGASNFATAFMGARERQADRALKMEEIKAVTELRQLQMQKIKKELEPIELNLEHLNMIGQAYQGNLISDSAYKKSEQQILDNLMEQADSPIKTAMIQQFINRKSQEKNTIKVEPGAAKLYGQIIGHQNQANIAAGRNQTQLDVAGLNARSKEDLLRLKGHIDLKLKELDSSSKERRTGVSSAARVEAAKIGAGARIQAAKISASKKGKGKDAGNPDAASLRKQIEQARGKLADFYKAKADFMELPAQRKQREQSLIDNIRDLEGRYQNLTGGTMGNTAAPAAKPSPSPAAPAPAPSGPTSLKGAAQAAKVGDVFEFGGKRYKKINDSQIEEAQ